MDLPLPPDLNVDEDWQEDEEYDEEDDADYDAEAEEMARRLGDQLLADIAKAQLEAGLVQDPAPAVPPATAQTVETAPPIRHAAGTTASKTIVSKAKKQEAALATMKTIIKFAAKDAQVRATLTATVVAHGAGSNIFDILTQCISAGRISKPLAKPLSDAVVSLAKTETLFSVLRNSDAAAIQLDIGKRKRDQTDDGAADARNAKRALVEYPDLLMQISEAARVVSNSLASRTQPSQPPDPVMVTSIHHQLHQIFLFAVTSTPRGRPELQAALQELGGLIQMLGIITNIPIGNEPLPSAVPSWATDGTQPTDIGAAVYPCLVGSCTKVFHRLYSLRTHQRLHTLVDRPYRCTVCPASFLRNHDLKRHVKLHDKKAWKCCGCDKIFSRRDAIKRHKDARGRGTGGGKHRDGDMDGALCASAAIQEVEVDRDEGDEEASRRAKMWNGIVANQIADSIAAGSLPREGEDGLEEGEIPLHVIQQAQDIVMRLHPVLHSHVAGALGGAPPPTFPHAAIHRPPAQPPQPPPMASLQGPSPVPPPPQQQPVPDHEEPSATTETSMPAVGLSWLSEEQTKLLEQAIAQAASAAQAQAEAEAALEEDEEEGDEEGEGDELEFDASS
ncbi:hypothetical protein BXZ70DRAFT_331285 [Cristinia sonorae]|uniref:C2H2-type domain-containing protein n=1 Tax=Cristinia sonorae TaxID=1940300 RepID=A0A8K0XN73_9AGAR|nr:hypothetical protein BXZ70DRAFT_331285 [Cristinia sonorae]